MRQREHLSRIRERHRAFTRRVERGEQVDKKADDANASGSLAFGDVETEAGGKQSPSHLREGKQEERTATESVDGEEGRPGEEKVDSAEAKREEQGFGHRAACGCEDGG